VTVISSCSIATISGSNLVTQTYIAQDVTPLVYTLPTFTSSDNECSIDYTLTLSSGAAYDTSVITFDSTLLTITVYTNDLAKKGTYNMKLVASINGFTS
jgi:hypothetical protein